MRIEARTPDEYVQHVPTERRAMFSRLRAAISDNLPEGFEETMSYGMIGYVVPHGVYPAGYHCDPTLPLPYMSIASQKQFIGFYHMGIYAEPELLDWFVQEYNASNSRKLDMGKSCIRFKKWEEIPLELIATLVRKRTPQDWIEVYERLYKKR